MSDEYLKGLISEYPDIKEVWLIGSRANDTPRPDSDWDYLVFADRSVLHRLTKDLAKNHPDIDLLVVYDGENFCKPWPDGPRQKKGSLSGWQWRRVSAAEATYRATRAKEGSEFYVEVASARAVRVRP